LPYGMANQQKDGGSWVMVSYYYSFSFAWANPLPYPAPSSFGGYSFLLRSSWFA